MNKAEKIKAEIERLQSSTLDENSNFKSQYDQGIFNGLSLIDNFIDSLEEEPISNDLGKELDKYFSQFKGLEKCYWNWRIDSINIHAQGIYDFAKHFAQWQKGNLWKDAQGDDLPEIDREVIVLAKALPEHEDSLLKVSIAHRPPEYWMGKNIGTGEITRYEPMRYDKGQWSMPAVVWWLDAELPKNKQ